MFTESVARAGAPLAHLDWRPAGDGDAKLAWGLAQLAGDPDDPESPGTRVDRANQVATERMLAARPVLVDVALRADEIWPELWANGKRTLTHAGAPIPWARMCDPMKGTMIGAMLYEGWAATPEAGGRSPRARRGRVPAEPRRARGGPDVGRDFAVDAGVRGEERDARQHGLHELQRGHRPRVALRRLRPRSDRAAEVDRGRDRAGAQDGARRPSGRRGPQVDPVAGAADGRRGAQPECRGDGALSHGRSAARSPAARSIARARARRSTSLRPRASSSSTCRWSRRRRSWTRRTASRGRRS